MMRRTVLCSLGTLVLEVLPLGAADLSGKWSGTLESRKALLILKVDGSSLSGSIGRDEDNQDPIENGRVERGKITFEVTNNAVIRCELTVDVDTLKGSCTRTLGGQTMHGTMELRRIR